MVFLFADIARLQQNGARWRDSSTLSGSKHTEFLLQNVSGNCVARNSFGCNNSLRFISKKIVKKINVPVFNLFTIKIERKAASQILKMFNVTSVQM